MSVDTKWFRDRLAERQMSQRGLARLLGMDAAAVSLLLRGRRNMRIAEAAEIARLLGVPAEEVMAHAGVQTQAHNEGAEVPVCSWMDGAAEVHVEYGTGQTAPRPCTNLPENVSACLCRTAGSDIDHMDGWTLFAQTLAPNQGIPAEAVGRLAFVKIRGGVIHLAKPIRSTGRGRWDLSSPLGLMRGVELEWAQPVLVVVP